jgi:hypothetical protein
VIRHGDIGLVGLWRAAVVVAGVALLPEGAGAANDGAEGQGKVQASRKTLNTIGDVSSAFKTCWLPPPLDQARPGMQITVIVSFTRTGEVNGEPRFSYMTPEATAAQRAAYQRAVVEAINRCTPLGFTPGLGNALAGRPFAIRFVDDRSIKSRSTEAPSDPADDLSIQ